MSVTQWFHGVTPAIPGPYEVKVGDENDPLTRPFWQFWNGEFWGHRKETPDAAERMSTWRSNEQSPTWRGCTTPRVSDGGTVVVTMESKGLAAYGPKVESVAIPAAPKPIVDYETGTVTFPAAAVPAAPKPDPADWDILA